MAETGANGERKEEYNVNFNVDLNSSLTNDETNLENNLIKRTDSPKLWVALTLAATVIIVIPLIAFGIFAQLWVKDKPPVDRLNCKCSCFDTIFKGPYEKGISGYKNVYFNSTANTAKIWTWTVLGIVVLYECLKSLFYLTLTRNLRWSVAIMFVASLHSHVYAWWMFWGYWNDHFYDQWYHQLFFTVTEVISTTIAFRFIDKRTAIKSELPLVIIMTISAFHVYCGSVDQFVVNVIFKNGQLHQVLRDIPLMLADVVQISLAVYEIQKYIWTSRSSFYTLFVANWTNLKWSISLTLIMFVLYKST